MKHNMRTIISSIFLLILSHHVYAATYSIPPTNESLIGRIEYSTTQNGDTVVTIAKQYDVGHNAIENANPYLDMTKSFTTGTNIQIPTQHILPNQTRQGIIINLPEMRMYYYQAGTNDVLTFPIGIGKIGKTIPITKTIITRKTTNPTWIPPQDIREFNLEKGIVLPKIMPPGPDNPLGPYAIYTGLPTYLIHSTIFPESVGTRASFGCIRMYESDIKDFFPSIEKNIPVAIINSPIKVGWNNKQLYIEAHHPLEEHDGAYDNSLPGMVTMVTEASKSRIALIDWQLVSYINKERDGIPHEIGIDISP
jgi:L,D-transpeptidase ErfK/SrfK